MATILIVEDEAYAVMSLRLVLRMLGHTVIGAASSGEKALEIAAHAKPDLMLVDLHLSGMLDGVETVSRIRQFHPVPVVFMTGYQDDETMCRLDRLAHACSLFKPFDADDVAKAVKCMLA